MARLPELEVFAQEHDMLVVSVEDLVQYRLRTESVLENSAESALPTEHGDFRMTVYTDSLNGKEHVALVSEPLGDNPLVRIHSECMTGDIFGSRRCDCGVQLDSAMERIAEEGGMIIYLRQEGRDIGLTNKIKAYALQDEGMDTVDANLALGLPEDAREYYAAAHILRDFGIERIRLMTNNPDKMESLEKLGVRDIEREPTIVAAHDGNRHYLKTKQERMGHMLPYLNGVAHG